MVVKVQLSMTSSSPAAWVLVYTRDLSVFWEGQATPEIVQAMAGQTRAFFEATVVGASIEIGQHLSEQGW